MTLCIKNMKMLFVSQNVAPFRINWLVELSKYMEIEVIHLNEYDKTCNKKFLENIKEEIKIVDASRKFMGQRLFNLREIFCKEYDVLVLDGYGFLGQMVLILMLKIKKMPFIMSIDGGIIPEKEGWIKQTIKSFLLGAADAYLSTAKCTDDFIRNYVTGDIKIYRHLFSSVYKHEIIDYDKRKKFHDIYKKELGLDGNTVVLCVGRFIPLKRYEIVIKAAEESEDSYRFIFIGGKPTDEYLALLNEKNRHKIQFIDFLYSHELEKYYIAADIFCHPTQSDVWGLVIGEAMAKGLPIVSSKGCKAAISMVEKNNGVIIESENPKEYIEAFTYIMAKADRAEKMQQANIELMQEYSIENSAKIDAKNIVEYYNERK